MLSSRERGSWPGSWAFKGLGLEGGYSTMSAQFLQISEVEGLSTVSSSGHGIPMETAQGIDEKGLPIAPLTHQDKGHLWGRSSLGGVSDTRDKTVDFVIHPDDSFITHPENFKVVGAFSIDDNPFYGVVVLRDRPGHGLKGIILLFPL